MVSSSGYTVSVSVFQGAPPPLGEGAASSGEDVYYPADSLESRRNLNFFALLPAKADSLSFAPCDEFDIMPCRLEFYKHYSRASYLHYTRSMDESFI